MEGKLCRFYRLPQEIQDYIFFWAKTFAVDTIINNWYIYLNKKVYAINLVLKLPIIPKLHWKYNIYIDTYNLSQDKITNVFSYCNKILSGKEDRVWWNSKLKILRDTLDWWLNFYNDEVIANPPYSTIPDYFLFQTYNAGHLSNITTIDNFTYCEHLWSCLDAKFNDY